MFIYENEVDEDSEPDPFDGSEGSLEERKDGQKDFNDKRKPSSTVFIRKEGNDKLSTSSKKDGKFKVRSTISKKKPGNQIQNEDSQYMAELC